VSSIAFSRFRGRLVLGRSLGLAILLFLSAYFCCVSAGLGWQWIRSTMPRSGKKVVLLEKVDEKEMVRPKNATMVARNRKNSLT